jgi:hypothetical protein
LKAKSQICGNDHVIAVLVNIQFFAMQACKHTPLAYYACTYSTTTYSYLLAVERAYIAAQAQIVDILHKEQNQRKKTKVTKTNNTQIISNQYANILKLYNMDKSYSIHPTYLYKILFIS